MTQTWSTARLMDVTEPVERIAGAANGKAGRGIAEGKAAHQFVVYRRHCMQQATRMTGTVE